MMKTTLSIALTVLTFNPLFADSNTSCNRSGASPLTSVADFNADGIVNGKDIAALSRLIGHRNSRHGGHHKSRSNHSENAYYALYDRNADGELDNIDVFLATRDMGKSSTQLDKEMVTIYQRFQDLQTVRGYDELGAMGYQPIPVALKGHGVHWFNEAGLGSMFGQKQPSLNIAEGLNVSTDEKRIHALFYAAPANPVFENGATDYPQGDSWKDSPVIAFTNTPTKLTSNANEMWHKHGGLCMPLSYVTDASGNKVLTGEAHQYTTYNECQAMPSDESMMPDGSNMWANFWMVHLWIYDLNPNGLYAGTHPCVEPNAPSAETINGNREVPMFFMDHDDH